MAALAGKTAAAFLFEVGYIGASWCD